MRVWFRSQDECLLTNGTFTFFIKSTVINLETVTYFDYEVGKNLNKVIKQAGTHAIVLKNETIRDEKYEGITLATYSTKEKAKMVLNGIENHFANGGYGNLIITGTMPSNDDPIFDQLNEVKEDEKGEEVR